MIGIKEQQKIFSRINMTENKRPKIALKSAEEKPEKKEKKEWQKKFPNEKRVSAAM